MKIHRFRNKPFVERLLRLLPDKLYISLLYRKNVGRWPSLSHPCTFTEKLQWLKLHDRNPLYSILVDKHAVKPYISNKIGSEHVIPTLAVWNTVDEINPDVLPKGFVLKWNHDSGSIFICRDKSSFDLERAKRKLSLGQRRNGFWYGREWPYKNITPCILAEQLLVDSDHPNDLIDYKFYCFNGEPAYCQVIRDRHVKETIDFYDMDWNHQEFVGLNPKAPNGSTPVAKPVTLDLMKGICKQLSHDIPFVRIDLYEVDGKVSFGEMTFYPASGFGRFTPSVWDERLGDMIHL